MYENEEEGRETKAIGGGKASHLSHGRSDPCGRVATMPEMSGYLPIHHPMLSVKGRIE
jgi:hypothetical protein